MVLRGLKTHYMLEYRKNITYVAHRILFDSRSSVNNTLHCAIKSSFITYVSKSLSLQNI